VLNKFGNGAKQIERIGPLAGLQRTSPITRTRPYGSFHRTTHCATRPRRGVDHAASCRNNNDERSLKEIVNAVAPAE